jgi:hypothetical protein
MVQDDSDYTASPNYHMVMSGFGTSRHFAAAQQFGRFRSEADIEPLTEPDF